MPNTVYGPFTPINVVNGSTPNNATWGNNAQTQASAALHGFNGDLLAPFVLSGVTCARNGTTLNQLDVTSGSAYVKFADSTVGLVSVVASTAGQFTTSTPSTTYYLFLLNTGLWQWGTTSTGPANSLAICQATTDGSGNILVVTDKRPMQATMLGAAVGLTLPPLTTSGVNISGGPSGSTGKIGYEGSPSFVIFRTGQTGATPQGFIFQLWDGAAIQTSLGIGSASYSFVNAAFSEQGALAKVGNQTTAGARGAPITLATTGASPVHITTTTAQQTILSFTAPVTGMYRANLSFYVGGTVPATITAAAKYFSGNNSTNNPGIFFSTSSGALNAFSIAAVGENATEPVTFYAAATKTILIYYTNATATPNDFVSAVIELL